MATKIPTYFVIRCEPERGLRHGRCGSGQVLLRTTLEFAQDQARRHAARRPGHAAAVYPVRMKPVFTADQARISLEGYKDPPFGRPDLREEW